MVPGARADVPRDVDRDLARANLLRVRGDYDGAEAACLSILKRYPNSAPTHTLLGDIADDRGNLEEAEKWYELALDLDPESPGDRRKLEDVRARRHAFDAESTVEQIGLPPRKPIPWFNVGLAALAVASFACAAYVGFTRRDTARNAPAVVNTPVQAPADAVVATKPPETKPTAPAESAPKATEPAPAVTPPPGAQEDETTRSLLAQRSPAGASLIAAQTDPRAKLLMLTYVVRPGEDFRRIGATLARTALEMNLETQVVTLRGVQEGRLVYVADVPRTRYADTLTDAWQADNASTPDAFEGYVLSNEWTAPSSAVQEATQRP